MDFDDTAELAAFRSEARTWLEAHAQLRTGDGRDWARGPMSVPPDQSAAYLGRCRDWQRTLYDGGWAGLTWPVEWGGRGLTGAHSIVFNQEAAAFDVSTGFIGAAQQLVGPALLRHGTDEQKREHLPPLLRGDVLWCQLFSEPGAGSDLAALSTRAVLDGDEWIVTGQKVWSSGAQDAQRGILLVRTDPDVPKHQGITMLVLDMDLPGVEVRPLVQATGAAHFNEVFLDEVRVPADRVIGEVHGGWTVARTVLASEAGMIGGASAHSGYDALLRLARERGRTDDPLVRIELADVWMRERILRFMGWRMQTAVVAKRGRPPDPSVLKNFFTRSLSRRLDLAVALDGARGMLWEDDAGGAGNDEGDGYWPRQLVMQFASRIGGGTEEVHCNNIGERALGLPHEPRTDRDVPWSQLPRS